MRCSTGASAFSAAHQMLCGRLGSMLKVQGHVLPPSHLWWLVLAVLGTWLRPPVQPPLSTRSPPSWRCWCGRRGRALLWCSFYVKLLVSLSLVIIHHTKRPRLLRGLLVLVPKSRAAGCSGANRETRSVFLPLQLLAWSLAGGIGSWLSPTGDGVWMSIVLVWSPGLPAPALHGMCQCLRCSTRTCGRTWGFGGQVEFRNWIFCRKEICPISYAKQMPGSLVLRPLG